MSILNNVNKYYCEECGWEDSITSTHNHVYKECKSKLNNTYKYIDIIEQLFILLNAQKEISIYRSDSVLNKAYISIRVDNDYDNNISGDIEYSYKEFKRKDVVIKVYNKYKNIEKYLLLIANELWVNTESDNGHTLDIIKKNENYILEVPVLEFKKSLAINYWR